MAVTTDHQVMEARLPGDGADLIQTAMRLVHDCVGQIRGYGIAVPRVEIVFDLRGTTAGQALVGLGVAPKIRLNPVLMAENREAFLRQTVPHEVAHLAAFYWKGKRPQRPHGPEWKRMMLLLGAEPRRCHNYDVTNARARRVATLDYACGCGIQPLTVIRHNRIQAGVEYRCRRCGESLRGPIQR